MTHLIQVCKYLFRAFLLKLRLGRTVQFKGIPRIGTGNFISARSNGLIVMGRIGTGKNVVLSSPGGRLYIDNGVSFNNNCYVTARSQISIGRGCTFGPNVCVVDHDHAYSEDGVGYGYKLGKIEIGKKCWIGANAVILRNTIMGDGCIVGAGTVVKGIIPAHSLVISERKVIMKNLQEREKDEAKNI